MAGTYRRNHRSRDIGDDRHHRVHVDQHKSGSNHIGQEAEEQGDFVSLHSIGLTGIHERHDSRNHEIDYPVKKD